MSEHASSHVVGMSPVPDENDDILPSDVPHDVVIQEALSPYFGGFDEAEEASKVVYRALVVTYRRVIVEAEDLAYEHAELEQLRTQLPQCNGMCLRASDVLDDLSRVVGNPVARAHRSCPLHGDLEAVAWELYAALTKADERLALARDALLRDGYFTPDQVGPDIAPRIVERLAALDDQEADRGSS